MKHDLPENLKWLCKELIVTGADGYEWTMSSLSIEDARYLVALIERSHRLEIVAKAAGFLVNSSATYEAPCRQYVVDADDIIGLREALTALEEIKR